MSFASRKTKHFAAFPQRGWSGGFRLCSTRWQPASSTSRVLMLGPHLKNENLGEVLARAKHRTKKEIAPLVRVLDPLPAVPARIEPLGSAPARLVPKTPTWAAFMQSLCLVRELSAGERPRDWVEPTSDCANDAESARPAASPTTSELEVLPEVLRESASHTPTRLEPERFGVHFTASEEYVTLVAEAQALLSHSAPRISLDELHLRAMRALVAELKRKKYALHAPARKPGQPSSAATAQRANENSPAEPARVVERDELPRRHGQHSRHIPAALRRAVYERDGERCTFTDQSGLRCAETPRLELHHVEPFAQGGEHTADNLTLHCRAHNALAQSGTSARASCNAISTRETTNAGADNETLRVLLAKRRLPALLNALAVFVPIAFETLALRCASARIAQLDLPCSRLLSSAF